MEDYVITDSSCLLQESAKISGSDSEKREKKAMEKKLANIREQIKVTRARIVYT